MYEKEEEQPFSAFANEVTVHGLNKMADTRNATWRRILWLLIVLLMLASLIAVLVDSVIKFQNYSTTTAFSLKLVEKLPFPSISVCNNVRIRKSFIDSDPMMKQFFNESAVAFHKYVDFNTLDSEVVEWANGTDGVTLFVNGMVRRKDFIRSCSLVNGHGVKAPPCPKPQYYVTQLGVCYTMSAEIHTTPASPNSGIMFELDVHQDEYSSEVNSKAVGAKIAIHRPGTFPSLAEMFSVSPGTEVQISLAQKEVIRLGAPYNEECSLKENYTQESCFADCFVKNMDSICGCYVTMHYTGPESFEDLMPNCTVYQMYTCLPTAYVYGNQSGADNSCDCPPACQEVTYGVQLSQMSYPAEHAATIMQQDINYARRNMISVNTFFRTMNVEKTEQKPAYTFQDLVADVGGFMGLFLGASIISISELLEFLAVMCFAKCQTKPANVVSVQPAKT